VSEPDSNPDADASDDGQAVKSKRWTPKLGGRSVGAAMAGLEAAVFRTLPPPIEVVEHSRHDGPMVTGDGTLLTITLPDPRSPASREEPPPTDE
jgi:hypothetical protein